MTKKHFVAIAAIIREFKRVPNQQRHWDIVLKIEKHLDEGDF